jgi:hypothetical protein
MVGIRTTGFNRIGQSTGFNRFGLKSARQNQKSAWQTMKANRARIAASLSSAQSNLSSITSAFASAQQNRISGLGILAANAALARVQAEAKAKSTEILTQIDGVQKTINDTNTASTASTTTPSVLNKVV